MTDDETKCETKPVDRGTGWVIVPPYEAPAPEAAPEPILCALCGKPVEGFATVGDLRLCHPDDPAKPDCYHRWTVYGERPGSAPEPNAAGAAAGAASPSGPHDPARCPVPEPELCRWCHARHGSAHPPTDRPPCPACLGTRTMGNKHPRPCTCCADGTARGVTDDTEEEREIDRLRARVAELEGQLGVTRSLLRATASRLPDSYFDAAENEWRRSAREALEACGWEPPERMALLRRSLARVRELGVEIVGHASDRTGGGE